MDNYSHYHKVLNAQKMVDRRKELRNRSTAAEDLLWQVLRNGRLGLRFKRQYSIVNYVVDFFCAKAKLAIELDGNIHSKPNTSSRLALGKSGLTTMKSLAIYLKF